MNRPNVPNSKLLNDDGEVSKTWTSFFESIANTLGVNFQDGPTADRPTSDVNGFKIGTRYFDTDLGIEISVKQVLPAVVWVNGAGVPV